MGAKFELIGSMSLSYADEMLEVNKAESFDTACPKRLVLVERVCDLVCLGQYLDLVAVIVFDSAIAGVGVPGEDKS